MSLFRMTKSEKDIAKRWQDRLNKVLKDAEDHNRRLHRIIKHHQKRYGDLLKKFLENKDRIDELENIIVDMLDHHIVPFWYFEDEIKSKGFDHKDYERKEDDEE